ncbi:MAG: hypothetical protein HY747_07640 [Elusimicrobia bacterium]|nr:hypothetical protein [Elusimicrobiota bacterium]
MMRLRLKDIPLELYVGDLPHETTRLQRIDIALDIEVRGKPPDYWEISKNIVEKFGGLRYKWLEDLALAVKKYLKKTYKIKGALVLSKYPGIAKSPKVFQVEVSL